MAEAKHDSVNEQIRCSIRKRFGDGSRFTIRTLRIVAPELSHVEHLVERIHRLAATGFLRVARKASGHAANRWQKENVLTRFCVAPIVELSAVGGVTVRRRDSSYVLDLDAQWSKRIACVSRELGISSTVYLRELVESDLARRTA